MGTKQMVMAPIIVIIETNMVSPSFLPGNKSPSWYEFKRNQIRVKMVNTDSQPKNFCMPLEPATLLLCFAKTKNNAPMTEIKGMVWK